jgi:hypothetical protein
MVQTVVSPWAPEAIAQQLLRGERLMFRDLITSCWAQPADIQPDRAIARDARVRRRDGRPKAVSRVPSR